MKIIIFLLIVIGTGFGIYHGINYANFWVENNLPNTPDSKQLAIMQYPVSFFSCMACYFIAATSVFVLKLTGKWK